MPNLKTFDAGPIPNLLQTNFLNRITCNLFNTNNNAGNVDRNQTTLERRTIDTNHISTISSLVDRSKVENESNIYYDSQKHNYGLYALKHNRSMSTASRRSGTRMNLPQRDDPSATSATTTTTMVHFRRSLPYESKHEYFEPNIQNRSDEQSRDENIEDLEIGNEYYKIEFSEEGGLKELKYNNHTNVKINNNNNNNN